MFDEQSLIFVVFIYTHGKIVIIVQRNNLKYSRGID